MAEIDRKMDISTDVQVQQLIKNTQEPFIVETTTTTTTTTTTKRICINSKDKNNIDLTEIQALLNDETDAAHDIDNGPHADDSHLKSVKNGKNHPKSKNKANKHKKHSILSSTKVNQWTESEEEENMEPKTRKSSKKKSSSNSKEFSNVSDISLEPSGSASANGIENLPDSTTQMSQPSISSQHKLRPKKYELEALRKDSKKTSSKSAGQTVKHKIPEDAAQRAQYMDDLIHNNIMQLRSRKRKVEEKEIQPVVHHSTPERKDLSAILEDSKEINELSVNYANVTTEMKDMLSNHFSNSFPGEGGSGIGDKSGPSPYKYVLPNDNNVGKKEDNKAKTRATNKKPKAKGKQTKETTKSATKENKRAAPKARSTQCKESKPKKTITKSDEKENHQATNARAPIVFENDIDDVPAVPDADIFDDHIPAQQLRHKSPIKIVDEIKIYSPSQRKKFKKIDNKIIITKAVVTEALKEYPEFCGNVMKRFNEKGEYKVSPMSTLVYIPTKDETHLANRAGKADILSILQSKRRDSILSETKHL